MKRVFWVEDGYGEVIPEGATRYCGRRGMPVPGHRVSQAG